MSDAAALLRFHAHVGARVAIRSLAPILGTVFGLFYLLKPEFFLMLARHVFVDAGPPARGMITAAVLLAAAGMVIKRVCFGLGGWIRHLPVSGLAHRRAAIVAVTLAETPITALLLAFFLLGTPDLPGKPAETPLNGDRETSALQAPGRTLEQDIRSSSTNQSARNTAKEMEGAVGLLIASAAAAAAVIPARNSGLRFLLGGAAGVLAGSGRILFMGPALLLLAAVDNFSGPLRISRAGPGRRRWAPPIGFPALLSLRALGISGIAGYIPAGAAIGLAVLFLGNNDLSPPLRAAAMRSGGILSVAVFLAVTAGLLVAGRAPWPWSRSWPRSSLRRIISDSLFLFVPSAILLGPLAALGWPAAAGALLYLPAGAVRAAGAVNGPKETRARILGTLLLEGSLAAAAVGLWTGAGLILFLSTPLFVLIAARREQTLKVTAWSELHHDAAGDPGSWSTR